MKNRPAIVFPIKKDNKKIMFIVLAVIVLGVVFSLGRCSSNDSDDLSKKESKIENLFNQPSNKSLEIESNDANIEDMENSKDEHIENESQAIPIDNQD